jgi:BlaI family transcriptional regulator, penicillinase repressor
MPQPSKIPPISDAEWDVMKVLWDHAGKWFPVAAIIEPVSQSRGIHHRTARTLLARLVKKGAVETRVEGAAYFYRARGTRDAVIRDESRSVLSRVFDGDAAPAIVHLLSESRTRLSPADIQRHRALLQQKEKS